VSLGEGKEEEEAIIIERREPRVECDSLLLCCVKGKEGRPAHSSMDPTHTHQQRPQRTSKTPHPHPDLYPS
jgi:hypothetical protein